MNTLYVILGAAIGAPARFAIDQYIRKFTNKPYGIFLVNILGSFLLGMTFKSSEKVNDLLAIGFAGAFTTWSTFMLDIYLAFELRRYKDAAMNLVLSLGIGLLAAWCGLQLAQRLHPLFNLIRMTRNIRTQIYVTIFSNQNIIFNSNSDTAIFRWE